MSSLPSNMSISDQNYHIVPLAGPVPQNETLHNSQNNTLNNTNNLEKSNISAEHISNNVMADISQPNIVKRVVYNVRRRHTISSIQKEQKSALPASERMNYRDRYVIVKDEDLTKVGGKKCQKYDKYNEAIWKRNLDHFQRMQRVHSKRAHSAIKIENPLEELPKTSNYERFIIHQQRNQPTNCLEQTAAILYLCSNPEYQLVDDLGSMEVHDMQTTNPNVIFFECHQAIELANARVQATGDNDYKSIIARLRDGFTIVRKCDELNNSHTNTNTNTNSHDNTHNCTTSAICSGGNMVRSYSGHLNAQIPREAWPQPITQPFHKQSAPIPIPSKSSFNTNMECCRPEHHNIQDKVEHFNNIINGSRVSNVSRVNNDTCINFANSSSNGESNDNEYTPL